MRALASYRPNDPSRPTICLVHGLNSSSGGYVHVIPWLEEAGYGIVIYDYPYNRPIEESCAGFARDWAAFRKPVRRQAPVGDLRPFDGRACWPARSSRTTPPGRATSPR